MLAPFTPPPTTTTSAASAISRLSQVRSPRARTSSATGGPDPSAGHRRSRTRSRGSSAGRLHSRADDAKPVSHQGHAGAHGPAVDLDQALVADPHPAEVP